MRFGDLIGVLHQELDLTKIRITAFPDLIWLFGGLTSVKPKKKFCSFRNVFLLHVHDTHHALSNLVRIPEDYKEWNSFNGYPDLLEFERDAGYLAKATVIFCEGPGALAELGAFASDDHLAARTIVVIQKDLREESSYITLGPVGRIENADEKSICVIDAKKPDQFPAELPLVIRAVEEKIRKAPKTETYQPNSVRDQFLLVADLVELYQAITVDELLDVLSVFGTHIPRPRLWQLLRQLILFELIGQAQVGSEKYLVTTPNSRNCIDYQSVDGLPPFDRSRYKAGAFGLLKDDADRFKAFQRSRKVGA